MAEGIVNNLKSKTETKRKSFRKTNTKPNLDFTVRRRAPPRPGKEKNDIFVSSKSDFRGYLSQCLKLVEDGELEVKIHALGTTIPKAINLGLQLHERLMGTYGISTLTDTVDVTDDFEPLEDEFDGESRVRPHSTVFITLYKLPVEAE